MSRRTRRGTGWRPLLRMGFRKLIRHKRRTVLISLLIGLPVTVGVATDTLYLTHQPPAAVAVRELMGTADAVVTDAGATKIARHPDMASTYVAYRNAPGAHARKPLTTTQVLALLPPGSTVHQPCVSSNGSSSDLLLRASDRAVDTSAIMCPATNRVAAAQVKVRQGRLPMRPDEIAVSSTAAARLRVSDLSSRPTVTNSDHHLTVVGIVDDPGYTNALDAWLGTDSPVADSAEGPQSWLVTFPPSVRDNPAALMRTANTLAAHGVWGNYADGILHPSRYPAGHRSADHEGLLLGLMCIAFGLVEVVLLAGAALSVGMRRQAHDIGLLGAAGGTRRDIRRLVLAQTLAYAITGSVLAVPAGLLAVLAAIPITDRLASRDMSTLGLAPWHWVGMASLGVVSGLIAGLLPAWRTSRLPVVDALAGRLGSGRVAVPVPWKRLGLLTLSAAAALSAGGWLTEALRSGAAGADNRAVMLPFYLLLAWTVAATLCVASLTNPLLGLLGQSVRGLPVTARFAIRDAGRQRSRTGPAAAAVTVSVAAALGLSFMLAGTDAQARQQYQPWLPIGDVMVYGPDGGSAAAVRQATDAALSVLPGAEAVPMYDVTVPTATKDNGDDYYEAPTVVSLPSQRILTQASMQVVTPALVAHLFGTHAPAAEHRLASGGAVLIGKPYGLSTIGVLPVEAGHVHRSRGTHQVTDPIRARMPVLSMTPPDGNGFLSAGSSILISPGTAEGAGLRVMRAPQTLVVPAVPLDQSTADKVSTVIEQVGGSAHAELGYQSQFPAMMLIAAGVAGFLAVAATLISLVLAQTEALDDLATLAAVGASPSRRRAITFWQALIISLVGGVSGTVLGGFAAYASRAFTGQVAIPWLPVLLVVVALPIVSAGLSTLCTRSKLPMVARLT